MPWNSVLSSHSYMETEWEGVNGKSYGGLLTNTYKFVPRKVLAATCFRRALFGIGTEKLSTKKRHAAKPAIGIIEQR